MSLSERAYQAIKHKIVVLELAPGSVIDENALQAELGLGRTPIREALQRLARDKLVRIVPRRGMFVADISHDDLPLLYETRAVLEAHITRQAALRGSGRHWQQMHETLAAALHNGRASAEQLMEADRACHEIIYQAADNKFLTDTLVMLYAQSQRLWHLFLPQMDMVEALEQHESILQLLRSGAAKEAAAAMKAHIDKFQAEIRAAMLAELEI